MRMPVVEELARMFTVMQVKFSRHVCFWYL